jgi:glucan biosynthesis protein C
MPSGSVPAPTKGPDRLAWIDQLRTLVIVLVVNMHACVTYSHVGSWYVNEGPQPLPLDKIAFGFWQGHLQSFFMGILFLIAGFFAYGSLARKGPAGFARERLFRLGAPTLFYMLVLHPLIVLGINPNGYDFGSKPAVYLHFITGGRFLSATGPMWFAAALLIFCLLFAAVQRLRPATCGPQGTSPSPPGAGAIWIWGIGLVALTFVVRTVEPVGQSVLNMQLCYFPQYILAFITGAVAARQGWLAALARSSTARRAGWMALFLGPLALGFVVVAGGILKNAPFEAFAGGWNRRSLGMAAWEQLAGLGLGLGALSFCSGKLNESTPLAKWLSERSFGVYLFHPVVLILITVLMRPLNANPFFKVSLLTGACIVGSFIVSDVARRIPGIRALV